MHDRWILYLQKITFVFKHNSRQLNWDVDALSERTSLLITMRNEINIFDMIKDLYLEDRDFREV